MRSRWPLLLVVATSLAIACGGNDRDESLAEPATDAPAAIEKVTQEGPVAATLTLTPAEPSLGDPIVLTLRVTAEPGVTVEMPAFGEALGRFTIVDFRPRQETAADGGSIQSQQYTLQAPMSGRQRVPPLRLEFIDERSTAVGPGADASAPTVRELLTEEIQVAVASVLPEGGAPIEELRPPRAELEEIVERSLLPWIAAALVALIAGLLGWRRWRAWSLERKRISAFDRALARMRRLQARGLPDADQADAWYVELSSIVRHYLEDRYAVRAPELTTEEFLREARSSAELTTGHRELLSSFLERCDRVKFAGYVPEQTESREAVDAARRFLEETRLRPEEERRKERERAGREAA